MAEAIELHSYCISQEVKNDSEEYYEIENAVPLTAETTNKNNIDPNNEELFFTHTDVKSLKKKTRVKKTDRQNVDRNRDEVKNIMDAIKLKLESAEPPIEKNVIQIFGDKQEASHLRKRDSIWSLFQILRSHQTESQHSWDRADGIMIHPNFPTHEKSTEKNVSVRYVKPYLNENLFRARSRDDLQQTARFLDITFNNIFFTHHHSFSLEKMLTIQLEDCFKKYTTVLTTLTEILKCIEVNRQTRESLKEKFISINPTKKNDIRFDTTIRKYTEAMIEFKDKYLSKVKEKRELANLVISLWLDLQNVRQKFGIAETALELDVKKLSLKDEDFSKKWNKIFEIEYSNMLIKLEYDYVTQYLNYKEVRKSEKHTNVPKPKLQINEDELKDEATKIVNFMLSRDEYDIKFKYNKKIAKALAKHKYDSYKNTIYFKIFVDDVFVCETEHVTVNDYCNVDYNDSVTVQVLTNNESVSIILCENSEDMSMFTVNIREIRTTPSFKNFSEKQFSYNTLIQPTLESAGSGISIKEIASINKIRLKSNNIFKGKIYTTCKVGLRLIWNDKLNKIPSESIQRFMTIEKEIFHMIEGRDEINFKALLEIINNIYDVEIEDQSVIDSLKDMCKRNGNKEDDSFKIDKDDNNVRFKLLALRNKGGFSDLKKKAIPIFESQITTDQLVCLEKSEKKDFDVEYIESKRRDLDPIDLQRYMGIKFVERVNKKILTDLHEKLLRKTHKDIVMDFKDLSWRSFFAQKTNMSLSPCSGKYRQQVIEEGLKTEQEIQVTVLRAFNLFDRRAEEGNSDYDDIAGFRMRPLRPFVRISYHDQTVQSPVAIGSHPTWNYTAKLKTKLDPLSSLHVNIYDEFKVGFDSDSIESRQSYRYRCYNKWLGTIAIPMNTVINMGKLQGTFKLSTPPFLFGYDRISSESTSIIPEITRLMRKDAAFVTLRITTSLSNLGECEIYNLPEDSDDPIIKHLNRFITEYLNDFPTRNLNLTFIDTSGKYQSVTDFIQPLPLPDILLRDPKTIESASKSSKSSSSSRKKSPNKINFKVENIFESGNPDTVPVSKLIDVAVRFVSLLPTYEPIGVHVTLRGFELLNIQYGSPLDHTLLLASYFIQLGIKCWVAIGYGLPRGLSSYVMTKYHSKGIAMVNDVENKGFLNRSEAHRVIVYDAVNGEKHDVRDVACPLKTINYVFDMENIWVNVQTSQDCENLSFDFSKSSIWQPVFDKYVFVMKHPAISYEYSPPDDVENLRTNLENKIKEKIQKWRWDIRTIWNRYLSNSLRESLRAWEYWSFDSDDKKPPLGQRLKQLMDTYKIFGFPINVHYINLKSVISRVKTTMIQLNDDPKVEFGLAVEVYAYPNNVLSVWVYLATMTRI